jgi:hypothetical protein
MASATEWKVNQGIGFLADVITRSVLDLERIIRLVTNTDLRDTLRDKLQKVIDRMYTGVHESSQLLPHVLESASRVFDEPHQESATSGVAAGATAEYGMAFSLLLVSTQPH